MLTIYIVITLQYNIESCCAPETNVNYISVLKRLLLPRIINVNRSDELVSSVLHSIKPRVDAR